MQALYFVLSALLIIAGMAGAVLPAIGDGTFGLMKRPADRGKGLDGVVEKATGAGGYDNPAVTLLQSGEAR